MKTRAGQLLLLLALGALLAGVTGCKSTEPSNASARPWNAPQGWEGGMPIENQQHE
jgi:hypothetical protein